MLRKMKTLPVLIAALALTACSVSDVSSLTDDSSTSSSASTEFQAAVFYYDYSDPYISSVRSYLTEDLTDADVFYREYDADSSQTEQSADVKEALAQGADVLLINIVNAGSTYTTDELCLAAAYADVPIVFFNRCIEADGDEGLILNYYADLAYVGTDPAEAGHLQGEMIGNYLLEHYEETDLNGDGVISYALFKGEAGNTEAIYRTKYAVEDADSILAEAGYPELMYFDPTSIDRFQLDLTGKWSSSAAQSYMLTNLSTYNLENENMIELVIANNDDMADGAIRALNTYNMNLGTEDCVTIPVFGVDATFTARQLIREGKMTGTIVQDAEGMAECIAKIVENVRDEKELLSGLDDYQRDEEHDLMNKLYLPYSVYEPDETSELPLPGDPTPEAGS